MLNAKVQNCYKIDPFHFPGPDCLENYLALVYTGNDQTETNSKGSNVIRPGAQPRNYVWHCRHLPNQR